MNEQLQGKTVVTRFNYHRPKWFGGFFGPPNMHNKPGHCTYDPEAMRDVLSPEDMNLLLEEMYTMTPVLAYHLAITVFLALSVLLTALQQGFNYLIEFGFITSVSPTNGYLQTLGYIWYVTWVLGVITIVPLYYVSLFNIERYFTDSDAKPFKDLQVKATVHKDPPGKFLLIPGFKKIDKLEFSRA